MIIILARHGNTFNPGDRVYRVGKRNDLPLTRQGEAQAEAFAAALIDKKIQPSMVFCSPLQRTQKFAQIIVEKMALNAVKPQVAECLNELDYGDWAGFTDEEIAEKYTDELNNWKQKSVWPQKSGWPESEKEIIESIKAFAQNLAGSCKKDEVVLVVSSCGKLRYFLKLVDNAFEAAIQNKGVAVKTGNACKITYENGIFKIESWNIAPAELKK